MSKIQLASLPVAKFPTYIYNIYMNLPTGTFIKLKIYVKQEGERM